MVQAISENVCCKNEVVIAYCGSYETLLYEKWRRFAQEREAKTSLNHGLGAWVPSFNFNGYFVAQKSFGFLVKLF